MIGSSVLNTKILQKYTKLNVTRECSYEHGVCPMHFDSLQFTVYVRINIISDRLDR